MTPVGQTLREARTRRGIDLVEAERVTKIRLKFLRAMEEDRWNALPEPVYARSFLSTYAGYLGLDDEPLLDEYDKIESHERPEPIPLGTIRPGEVRHRRRPVKPALLVIGGLVAIVLLGLVIVGSLGSSGGGGPAHEHKGGHMPTRTAASGPAAPARVALNLRSTAAVWVCLVNAKQRTLVAETLPPDETRGPFESRSFEVTFGNGSIEMTVDGSATSVPPLAEPLGYRITPGGIRRLDPAAQPTCA